MTAARVCEYLRVSSGHQETGNQRVALQQFAEARGWHIVKIYEEKESAWRAGRQHELARALQGARRRQFDILLVWSLDRLSREGPLAILSLVHRLSQAGVRVVSLQEPWTEAPGELYDVLLALTGWVAKMESERRSERTKAGLERARRQGKRLGRPPGAKDRRQRKKGPPRIPIWES